MPTNFKKREKHTAQCDAVRGQQAMDRLRGVVRREQRMQAKSGTQQTAANFNSQPQAGWKKEWKTTMARKSDSLIGPDATWTDEQGWLQGSSKCFDSRRPTTATKATGYPSATSSGISVATKPVSVMPSLPVLPEEVSRMTFQRYVAEVNAAVQHALLDSSVRPDSAELHRYTSELAWALRVLTRPAPASQKTQICEAMASVWDMRSNSALTTGAPLDLRALADALEALGKCCSSKELAQVPATVVEKT